MRLITATMAALAGCATVVSGAAIAPASQHLPAVPVEKRQANGTDGCGVKHHFNGLTDYFSMESSGRTRKYSVHLPAEYDENADPVPLVFGFHGTSSIGFFFEADTKFSFERFSGNKIMVYPDGIDYAWAGANYSALPVSEDLQFITDLLAHLRTEYCIDDSRIYATGISNGGGFVDALACSSSLSGEFAAFAPHSGSYYDGVEDPVGEGCTPARSPLPMLSFHGGNDQSVYYEGGTGSGGELPSIPDWLDRWVERNGCSGETTEDSFEGDVHHTTWTCGDAADALQHWKIDSMGHCWASTEINFSQLAAGEGPTHVDASQIIMDFFDLFTKP